MYKDQEQLLRTLVARNVISSVNAEEARMQAQEKKKLPEEVLTERHLVSGEDLTKIKSELLNIPLIDLRGKPIPKKTLMLIPQEVAENYEMIAFDMTDENELQVAMINPQNFKAIEAVEFLAQKSNLKVRYFIVSSEGFRDAFRQYRELGEEAEEALSRISESSFGIPEQSDETQDMEKVIKSAPVSKMVLVIMRHAIDGGASDFHIEPRLKETRVRYRIDGILRTSLVLPKYIHAAISARIKVLANMKLDEPRKPQDGRIRLTIDGREIDFRVSTLPMVEGEKVVLRILDTTGRLPGLDQLGFNRRHIEMITQAITKPHGVLLLTGPTGSGKTTTLYTILTMLNNEDVNIITLEDPIEYYIQGINQSQ